MKGRKTFLFGFSCFSSFSFSPLCPLSVLIYTPYPLGLYTSGSFLSIRSTPSCLSCSLFSRSLNQWVRRWGDIQWRGEKTNPHQAESSYISNKEREGQGYGRSPQLSGGCLAFTERRLISKPQTTVLYICFHVFKLSHSSASKESAWRVSPWDFICIS